MKILITVANFFKNIEFDVRSILKQFNSSIYKQGDLVTSHKYFKKFALSSFSSISSIINLRYFY